MEVSKEYLPYYANLFNRSQILDFINKIEAKNIKELLELSNFDSQNSLNITYLELYERIYDILKKEYRCEYVYLNEIFVNEILKNHREDCSIITELSINSSKIDLLCINGTTTAYEIKTELDSLSRLEKQLLDYTKAFDKVYVITYAEFVDKIKTFLEKDELLKKVGIKILEKDGKLKCIRKSRSFVKNFDRELIFKCLLKKEREVFGNTYEEARIKFLKRSNIYIHEYFKTCLIERKKELDFIDKLPKSLKMIGYKIQNTLNKSQKKRFYIKLNNKIKN